MAGQRSQTAQVPEQRQLAEVEGVLERITYANEETGYTVARVDTGRGANDLLTVVGALLGAQVGSRCGCTAGGARTRSTGASSPWRTTPRCCRPPCRASSATWVRA